MDNDREKFKRYAEELARSLDPQAMESSVTVVPVPAKDFFPPGGKGGGKNKKRSAALIGPVARLNTTRFDPLSYGSLAECLYFLEQQKSAVAAGAWSHAVKEPKSEPKIAISPRIFCERVALIPEQTLNTHVIDGQSVELVWQSIHATTPQRVVMNYQQKQHFRSTIGVEAGDYVFAYVVNNRMRPDSRYGQRLLIRPDAALARVTAPPEMRTLMLQNHRAGDEIVLLKSNVPWLVPEVSHLRIPGRSTVKIFIGLAIEEMVPGLNTGMVSVLARRGGNQVEAGTAYFSILAELKGAIPEIKYEPPEFGWISQGVDKLEFEISLRAQGRGQLTGRIITHHLRTPTKFVVKADALSPSTYKFEVDSASLPYRTEGAIKVTLLTDSYLANHRYFELEIPYRLRYLKKTLPALVFRSVPHGTMPAVRLEVKRSDGERVNLKVLVPEHIEEYLQVYPGVYSNVCSFQFDTHNLPPETVISEELTLVDTRSGIKDRIKLLASVGNGMIGLGQPQATPQKYAVSI
jgi:hypothetical protein